MTYLEFSKHIGLSLAALAGLLSSNAAASSTVFEDFTSTPQSFTSSVTIGPVGSTLTFTSSGGILVSNFGSQSIGVGLGGFGTSLLGQFSTSVSSLNFVFGNDDMCCGSQPGDLAVLRTFMNGALVGTSSVVQNRNDIGDQSISFSGTNFDSFSFTYESVSGTPSELAEIIDDVSFVTVSAVPEPGTWAMMLLGFGAIGWSLRRREETGSVSQLV